MHEETERKLSVREKFSNWLKESLQKIIIFAVSIIYISQGIFELVENEATILEIAGNVGLAIVVGVTISTSLNSMGLKDGRNSEIFQKSMQAYGNVKSKATPYFDKIAMWCEYKNIQRLEQKRKDILQRYGLSYKGYKFGYYEAHPEKLTHDQEKALHDVKNCRVTKLKSNELLSDLPGAHRASRHGNFFGESEREYKTRSNFADGFVKIGVSLVCGVYSLSPLLTEDNKAMIIAGVIWKALQILMWIALGLTKYINAKSFMEDEYRQTHIIQKTEYLNEFIITMQNNPKVIEEYDDSLEINKFIEEFIREKERSST